MIDEVDFVKEAQNIETFRRYLDDSGFESVCTAPYVYSQMSTRRYVANAKYMQRLCRLLGAVLTYMANAGSWSWRGCMASP